MASLPLKSTRKTYSFEERRILISLINKHVVTDDRRCDPISVCKRKSTWSRIADEYNSTVGPQGARSAVQLRRCWENMKTCKRIRDEKRSRCGTKAARQSIKDEERERNQYWEDIICGQSRSEAPVSIGMPVGLPPNVVFQPKDSEPFTLQSVCTGRPRDLSCPNTDADNCRDLSCGPFSRAIADGKEEERDVVVEPPPMTGESVKINLDSPVFNEPDVTDNEELEEDQANPGARTPCISISPSFCVPENDRNKRKIALRQQDELHMLALSEAQMKVDIAAMLKEEARIKLEEAHYRKEEARLRMMLFTYKLDRMQQN